MADEVKVETVTLRELLAEMRKQTAILEEIRDTLDGAVPVDTGRNGNG